MAISPFEMHPVKIALSLTTLDGLAQGRASTVLGGGCDLAQTLRVLLRNRVRAVGETIDIVRLLDAGGEVNYDGRMFKVKGLFSPWKEPIKPSLYVGANRLRMIRVAARKADGVMFTDMPLGHVGKLVDEIRSGSAGGRPGPWRVQDEQLVRLERAGNRRKG